MIQGGVLVLLGVWFLLIGLGKLKVSKDAEANARFLAKWRMVFLIGGPVMIACGALLVVLSP
jgi:hypothetical protein